MTTRDLFNALAKAPMDSRVCVLVEAGHAAEVVEAKLINGETVLLSASPRIERVLSVTS